MSCDNVSSMFGFGVGLMDTPPMAQSVETPRVQPMVTDDVAAFLPLLALRTSFPASPVTVFQNVPWPASGVSVSPVPGVAIMSMTSSFAALDTETEPYAPVPLAEANGPNGLIWSTPEKETAPAAKSELPVRVTMASAGPTEGGLRRNQISIRAVLFGLL